MRYEIIFRKRAKQAIKSIPTKGDRERIFETIIQLSSNPYPRGNKKLKGRDGYRVRQGHYRIIYEIKQEERRILILHVGSRKNIYQKKP